MPDRGNSGAVEEYLRIVWKTGVLNPEMRRIMMIDQIRGAVNL